MYSKILLIVFLLFFSIFKPAISMQYPKDGKKFPTLTNILKKDVAIAKQDLSEAKALLKNIKTDFKETLKTVSYIDSTKIDIKKDGQDEICFNFGYASHGVLTLPFTGFKTKVDFKKVPDWLETAFIKTLTSTGFSSIINISPENEFLLKLVLLFNDTKKKLITKTKMMTELLFLFYRLSLVKDFNGVKSLLGGDNNLIYKIISTISFDGQPITSLLDKYWAYSNDIINYDFSLEEGDPNNLTPDDIIKANDKKTIIKISAAILLRTAIDYYKAQAKFLKTNAGKNLNLKIKAATKKREKLKLRKEFAKALPQYQDILSETQLRVHGFLRRIDGIRKNWNKFVDTIRPILKPFFDSIGLPFDMIIRKYSDIGTTSTPEEDFYDDSEMIFDEDSSGIDFNAEENNDFDDF